MTPVLAFDLFLVCVWYISALVWCAFFVDIISVLNSTRVQISTEHFFDKDIFLLQGKAICGAPTQRPQGTLLLAGQPNLKIGST